MRAAPLRRAPGASLSVRRANPVGRRAADTLGRVPEPPVPTGRAAHRSPGRLVVLLGLFGFLLAIGWSLLTPAFLGPDELAHADIVYEQQATGTYPTDPSYRVHDRLRQAQRLTVNVTHRTADDPLARMRPTLDSWPDARIGWNQMTQHPPFGYALPAVTLRLLRAVSDPASWPYDRFLFTARALSALALVPVPLLVVATARRLRLSWPTATAAALLPFAVPQLTYVGGVVTNDTMLVLLGAATAYLVARVVTGDRSVGAAVVLGVVVGLALLTKAFSLMLFPAVGVAYVPRLRTPAAWRLAARRIAVFTGVATLTGGWWWVRNVVRDGTVQPQRAVFPDRPPGFVAQPMGAWLRHFGRVLAGRFWGSFGPLADGVRLAPAIVAIATIAAVALIVVAFAGADAPARHFGLVIVVLGGLVTASVLTGARRLHVDHALDASGIQGRYLFLVVPGLAVLAALGAEHLAGTHRIARNRLPFGAIVVVALMQLLGARAMAGAYWGAPGANVVDRVRALVAWSPLPAGIVAVWPLATIVVTGLLLRELVTMGRRPIVPAADGTRPIAGPRLPEVVA